jgi:hypothetical protein
VANAYTSTYLLQSLKRRGLIPTSASTFAASDFYKVLDEEVQTFIVPLLLEVREEYLVAYEDESIVSGTDEYDIPERAIAGKLRDVALSDGNGGFRPLSRFEPDHVDSLSTSISGSLGFYLRGNKVVLTGSPASGTLRFTYYQRPNRVVATDAVGEITAINTGTRVVTVSGSVPSTFTTSVTYDFVKGTPGFELRGKDLSASAVGASSVTFSATLPTDLAVGDFVCLANETPIPQVPVETHPLLAQRATATILHALGDPKAKASYELAADMEKRILKVLSPRVEGANRFVINRYGVGQSSSKWGSRR